MQLKNRNLSSALAVSAVLALTLVAGCAKKDSGGDDKKGGGGAPGAGAQNAANAPTPVTVARAAEQVVSRSVPVTGSITALQSVDLTPKVSANVISVSGREGDIVRAGQIVVQQDTRDLAATVQQNEANVLSAQAKLKQAQTQVTLQSAASSAGVQDAQQALASAESQLALAKRPQRSQEVAVAENNVAQAQANYDRAAADRQRYEDLVKQGAAAQITLDQYVTQEKVAKAALDSAKQQQQIAQIGGRAEQVQSAETAVRRAQAQLRLARANTQQTQVQRDNVRAAQAAVAQAQAQLSFSQQQLDSASIRAPITGIIASRTTEPGQLAGPGTPVLKIVALDTVYYQAQVPETDIASISVGKPVVVHVDAFPGKAFAGKVGDLYPTASTSSRNFVVRVTVPNTTRALRPGMFARGEVIIERHRAVVVPKDALVANGDQFAVFIADGASGKAVRRPVKLGIQTTETSEILKGVQPGEQVIVNGQGFLKDGAPIHVEGSGGGNDAAPSAAAAVPQRQASL